MPLPAEWITDARPRPLAVDRPSREGGNSGTQAPASVPLDSRLRENDDKLQNDDKRQNGDKRLNDDKRKDDARQVMEPDSSNVEFDAMTSRLLRREALRRAAEELNTTSGPGLEGVLSRISAEVTADAASRCATPTVRKPRP